MKGFFTRKRLSMTFAVLGVVLMGVDLMLTRNFFTHIGELMALSIFCFALALFLDRGVREEESGSETGSGKKGE